MDKLGMCVCARLSSTRAAELLAQPMLLAADATGSASSAGSAGTAEAAGSPGSAGARERALRVYGRSNPHALYTSRRRYMCETVVRVTSTPGSRTSVVPPSMRPLQRAHSGGAGCGECDQWGRCDQGKGV
eukprot:365532-Chlamydomonas_euryale.AAC.6